MVVGPLARVGVYAAMGVRELLMPQPSPRRAELLRIVDGRPTVLSADATGALLSEVLDLRLAVVEDRLRLTWDGGSADV